MMTPTPVLFLRNVRSIPPRPSSLPQKSVHSTRSILSSLQQPNHHGNRTYYMMPRNLKPAMRMWPPYYISFRPFRAMIGRGRLSWNTRNTSQTFLARNHTRALTMLRLAHLQQKRPHCKGSGTYRTCARGNYEEKMTAT